MKVVVVVCGGFGNRADKSSLVHIKCRVLWRQDGVGGANYGADFLFMGHCREME